MPLARQLSHRGHKVVYTARDNSQTVPLLEAQQVPFRVVGGAFGASKVKKVIGTLGRAARLALLLREEKPMAAISASRSCALAAHLLRIPSFVFIDYEFVELRLQRLLGDWLVVPDVIPSEVFQRNGLSPSRLIAYPGLKEDISMFGIDFDTFPPVPELADSDLVTVLVRPPHQEGHYSVPKSLELTRAVMEYLADREDVLLVFSPRYEHQAAIVSDYAWRNQPVILTKPIPFICLLKSVDLVVSGGGTMLREAAVLGIPAYSTLSDQRAAVDMYLEKQGHFTLITDVADILDKVKLVKRPPGLSYRKKPEVMDFIIRGALQRIG